MENITTSTTDTNQAGKYRTYKSALYEIVASTINAIENCEKTGNTEWIVKHTETLRQIGNTLPIM